VGLEKAYSRVRDEAGAEEAIEEWMAQPDVPEDDVDAIEEWMDHREQLKEWQWLHLLKGVRSVFV